MHHLQKYILDILRLSQPLSYSDMLPKGMESSHFNYHLKMLEKDGLVTRQARGIYALSHEGEAAVEYLSLDQLDPRRMPKVTTFTLITHKDHMLLLHKQKEPYRNMYELIAGKIHFGEHVSDAAQREMYEKVGLKIAKPHLAGVADVIINKDNAPLTHLIAYVHTLELDSLPQLPNTIWLARGDLQKQPNVTPITLPFIDAIDKGDARPFVLSLDVSMDSPE